MKSKQELFATLKTLMDSNMRLREAIADIVRAETLVEAKAIALIALAEGGTT